jgi:catechol 2,3-dioxygenase-like lactoylglutathione lyase family enzyme
MNAHVGQPKIAAAKLQHHVIYVSDLKRSKDFYMKLFDLQFSALNHPDSSAAMRLSNQEMHFFSFGFYHHDLCLVKHHKLKMDNNSMLHFTLVARDRDAFDAIRKRAAAIGIPVRDGRLIASAKTSPAQRSVTARSRRRSIFYTAQPRTRHSHQIRRPLFPEYAPGERRSKRAAETPRYLGHNEPLLPPHPIAFRGNPRPPSRVAGGGFDRSVEYFCRSADPRAARKRGR